MEVLGIYTHRRHHNDRRVPNPRPWFHKHRRADGKSVPMDGPLDGPTGDIVHEILTPRHGRDVQIVLTCSQRRAKWQNHDDCKSYNCSRSAQDKGKSEKGC